MSCQPRTTSCPPLLEVGGVVRAVQVSLGRVLEELLGGLELVLGVHQAVHEAAALLTHLGRGAAGEGAERVHGPEGRLSLRSILGVRWTTHVVILCTWLCERDGCNSVCERRHANAYSI